MIPSSSSFLETVKVSTKQDPIITMKAKLMNPPRIEKELLRRDIVLTWVIGGNVGGAREVAGILGSIHTVIVGIESPGGMIPDGVWDETRATHICWATVYSSTGPVQSSLNCINI